MDRFNFKVTKTLEIPIDAVLNGLNQEEALEIVRELDRIIADWDYTIEILTYYLSELWNNREEVLYKDYDNNYKSIVVKSKEGEIKVPVEDIVSFLERYRRIRINSWKRGNGDGRN